MIELLYRVVKLSQAGNIIQMVLQEVHTVPPEKIERARLEAEQEPEVDVVDAGEQLAKIGSAPPKDPLERMIWAWKRQFSGFEDVFKNAPRMGGGRMMIPVPIYSPSHMEMYLTPEQYVEMGSPSLLSVFKVSLKLESQACE